MKNLLGKLKYSSYIKVVNYFVNTIFSEFSEKEKMKSVSRYEKYVLLFVFIRWLQRKNEEYVVQLLTQIYFSPVFSHTIRLIWRSVQLTLHSRCNTARYVYMLDFVQNFNFIPLYWIRIWFIIYLAISFGCLSVILKFTIILLIKNTDYQRLKSST